MSNPRVETNFFTTGGTVQAGSGVYVSRRADDELFNVCQSGTFAHILTARQMGKSSLMVRTSDQLAHAGIRSAIVDLTQIGAGHEVTAEQWYLGQLDVIADKLGLQTDVIRWWAQRSHLTMTQRLTEFFENVLLTEISSQVVIFIDEIDTTLRLDFTDDFYAAIRYLYNARSEKPELKRLSFVLIGVAIPSDLIHNPDQTPFNIGQHIELTDFSLVEASVFLAGFGLPLEQAKQVLGWVIEWTGGHPYLTQRLCRAIAEENRAAWNRSDVKSIVEKTFFSEKSKQDTNLQFVRDMLTKRAESLAAIDPIEVIVTYRDVLRGRKPVEDDEQSIVKSHLKLSGVVRSNNGQLTLRNPIYGAVFDSLWIKENLPLTWTRQQLKSARGAILGLLTGLFLVTALGLYANSLRIKAQGAKQEADRQRQMALVALDEAECQKDIVVAAHNKADKLLEQIQQKNRKIRTQVEELKQQYFAVEQERNKATLIGNTEQLYREGTTFFLQNNAIGAIRKLRQALPCYNQSGNVDGEVATLVNIASAYKALNMIEKSVAYYRKAEAVLRAKADDRAVITERIRLHRITANTLAQLSQYDSTIATYKQAVGLAQQYSRPLERAAILQDLARIYFFLYGRHYEGALPEVKVDSVRRVNYNQGITCLEVAVDVYRQADTLKQAVQMLNAFGSRSGNELGSPIDSLQEQISSYCYAKALDVVQEYMAVDSYAAHSLKAEIYQELATLFASDRIFRKETAPENVDTLFMHYSSALAASKKAGHLREMFHVLRKMSTMYTSYGGQLSAAMRSEHYINAAEQLAQLVRGDSTDMFERLEKGQALVQLGSFWWSLDTDSAIKYYKAALPICVEARDFTLESDALLSIGLCYRQHNESDSALRYFADAFVAILQQFNGGTASSDVLSYVVDSNSVDRMKESANLYEQRGDYRTAINMLLMLGAAYSRLGDTVVSRRAYQRALALSEKSSNRKSQAIAMLLLDMQSPDNDVLATYHRILKMLRQGNDSLSYADVIIRIGKHYRDNGNLEMAMEYYQDAGNLFEQLGSRDAAAFAIAGQAEMWFDKDSLLRALRLFQKADTMMSDVRGRYVKPKLLRTIGQIYSTLAENSVEDDLFNYRFREAEKYFHRAEELDSL